MKKIILITAILTWPISLLRAQAQISNVGGGLVRPNVPIANTNVGINNTQPQLKLHIKTNVANDGILVEQTSTTFGASLNVQSGIGPQLHKWGIFASGSANTNLNGAGNFAVYDFKNSSPRLLIDGTKGNVGINTVKPLQKLHVHDGGILISGATAGFGGPQLLFTDNLTTYPNGRWGLEYLTAAPSRPGMGGMNFWRPFSPGTGMANYYLFLKDDGKTGMGVTDDNTDPNFCANAFPNGYRLYVKGGILTDKIKVAVYCSSQWADYVFAPEYKLRSLEEVETFARANKHLPGVPSAEEIVNDGGIDVNQMFAKQMEKIEELTLYMIALKKENSQLQKEIQGLKASIVSPNLNK